MFLISANSSRLKCLAILFNYVIACVLFTSVSQAEEKRIVIGSGGVTGVYYPVAISICRLFNAEYLDSGFKCTVEVTKGSVGNLEKLRAGEINFAIVQSDWQSHAYNGTSFFEQVGPHKELRSVFALYSESFTVLARLNSNISRFEELRRRRINIGNPGSGQRATMEVVMDAFGWSRHDFSLVREFNSEHQAQALCDNEVDAIVFVAGHPSGTIKSATEKCKTNFVIVDGKVIEALVEGNKYYRPVSIPAGVYLGQNDEIPTFGLIATLVTTSDTTSALVIMVLESVFKNFDRLRKMHPALDNLQVEDMKRDTMPAPMHDGAKSFYN